MVTCVSSSTGRREVGARREQHGRRRGPKVAVVGAGMAGLSAAVRLAERGYRVTLYEQKSMLGGNLGSRATPDRKHLDIYPHMCPSWYLNFWRLLGDVTGVERQQLFAPFTTVAQLRAGRVPAVLFHGRTGVRCEDGAEPVLRRPAARRHVPSGLRSDRLAGHTDRAFGRAERRRLSGFEALCHGSGCDRCRLVHHSRVAIPSRLASAHDYRDFLANSAGNSGPWIWMARGSAETQVIRPIEQVLLRLGAAIHRGVRISQVTCEDGLVRAVDLQHARFNRRSGGMGRHGDGLERRSRQPRAGRATG